MQSYQDFFADKRIVLMGLGLLGRGVGDAEFLAPLCRELVVTDLKSEADLADSLTRLKRFSNVIYHLGGHQEVDFTSADIILKAAGVPLNSPYIAAAQAAGVPVYMSTALFAKFAQEVGATIVGVTGTRGKSTVAHLMYHTLLRAGRPAHVAGNVRGLSSLALLPEIKKGDTVVMELDSWQLQGFGDLHVSPHIAVFTNLMPDHLNYYGGDMERYFWDKAQIFLHQTNGDKLVAGSSIVNKVQAANPPIAPLVPPPLPHEWHLTLLGEHNKENAALAVLALKFLGLSEGEIKRGIETFQPVEGRLQLVREIDGVKIYNDTTATTPEATIAALGALDPEEKRNVILIMGGADKGLDMSGMRPAVHAHCKKVFFLKGTGTQRVHSDAPDTPIFDSLEAAFDAALEASVAGDTILFSPAFASFGMFKNEYDRGDQFNSLVNSLRA